MKKIIAELLYSSYSKRFPEELINEIKPKLSDKDYSAKQFFEDYGDMISLLHEHDLRVKLQGLNNKMGFFVVLVVVGIIIGILSSLGALMSF